MEQICKNFIQILQKETSYQYLKVLQYLESQIQIYFN